MVRAGNTSLVMDVVSIGVGHKGRMSRINEASNASSRDRAR